MADNIIIVQSGGPTAVINNSLIGIIDGMKNHQYKGEIYGAVGGIHGLLNENFVSLLSLSVEERKRLRWTPGAALGTWRYNLVDDDLEKILGILKKYEIRYFFYIGGNGSMNVAKMINDIAERFNYNLSVIGVPKSVDNDLIGTDHTPGYGSTAKFLATSVIDVSMDMTSYPESNGVTIIETMGRSTGWLAASCALAEEFMRDNTQLLIYIPEVTFNTERFLEKIKSSNKEKKNVIVVVAEGVRKGNGQLLCDNNQFDALGRPKLGGVASYLKETIEEKTEVKARYLTGSIWQRSGMELASKTDIDEAYQLGLYATLLADIGHNNIMVTLGRSQNNIEYDISYESVPLSQVAGREKSIPEEWYDDDKNTMHKEFKAYVSPIIQGEISIPKNNGLPIYQRVI